MKHNVHPVQKVKTVEFLFTENIHREYIPLFVGLNQGHLNSKSSALLTQPSQHISGDIFLSFCKQCGPREKIAEVIDPDNLTLDLEYNAWYIKLNRLLSSNLHANKGRLDSSSYPLQQIAHRKFN